MCLKLVEGVSNLRSSAYQDVTRNTTSSSFIRQSIRMQNKVGEMIFPTFDILKYDELCNQYHGVVQGKPRYICYLQCFW